MGGTGIGRGEKGRGDCVFYGGIIYGRKLEIGHRFDSVGKG